MEHVKVNEKEIADIKKEVHIVRTEFNDHRIAQQLQEEERLAYRETRKIHDHEMAEKLAKISVQMASLIDLNTDVTDFKTAWRVGKKLGIGLAVFITTVSIISGGIWAVKEWIRKP